MTRTPVGGKMVFIEKTKGSVLSFSYEDVIQRLGVTGFVRFHGEEFSALPKEALDHFNLGDTTRVGLEPRSLNEPNSPYAAMKIVGHQDGEPILALEGARYAETRDIIPYLSYEELEQTDFVARFPDSFMHIKSAVDLRIAIYRRYRSQYRNLTPTELWSCGVTYTRILFPEGKQLLPFN